MRVRVEAVAAVVAVVYVLGVGAAMEFLSYDVWGAFVTAPVLVAGSYLLLRRLFVGDRAPFLRLAMLGLVVKLVGAGARYWVSYKAYLGATDSASYHEVAKGIAGSARAGERGLLELVPSGLGTRFIEQVGGVIYTVFGSSRLGGSFVFATLAFWGSVCYFLAAHAAVPGLRRRWYAVLVFFAPSIVYWPSSLGKEAWIFFALGVGTYGTVLVLCRDDHRRAALGMAVAGFVGAGFVRPHVAAMWVAGAGLALVAALVVRLRRRRASERESGGGRHRSVPDTVALGTVLVFTLVGFVMVAAVTLRFLDPASGEDAPMGLTDRVTRILDETERRSVAGGSQFTPPTIDDPTDWPVASMGTLVRPYPWQIDDLTSLLPGIETAVYVVLGLFVARRILSVHRQIADAPFLLMVICTTFMFGLAFSSIGNLGILTRQRSLVLPFGLVLLCLPYRPRRRRRSTRPVFAASAATVP